MCPGTKIREFSGIVSLSIPIQLTCRLLSSAIHPAADDCTSLQEAETARIAPAFSKGVKFQDGLSPGQGDEGETVIPGVDKHNTSMRTQSPVSEKPRIESKHRNLIERTTWTFIMIAGFIGSFVTSHVSHLYVLKAFQSPIVLLCMGHPYMILLVMLCQTLVYKEVTALFQLSNRKLVHLRLLIRTAAYSLILSLCYKDGETDVNGQGGFARRERWNKTLNW